MKMVTIYGNESCVFCLKAKKLLERFELKYEWRDTDEPDIFEELKLRYPDAKTIPQIWWRKTHIGGYTELVAEIENTLGGYGEQRI